MPFDYAYMSCATSADVWELDPNIDLIVQVSSKDGDIKNGGQKTGSPNGLRLSIGSKEWGRKCSLKGSLHKAFKSHNHDRFTFSEFCQQVKAMEESLHIDPKTTLIHSLEIQINLFLNESPQSFIQSAMAHKGKAFNEINPRHPKIGRIAPYDDREIKIYDKVKADIAKVQNQTERNIIKDSLASKNILRFGVAVKKMRYLEKYQIKTLSDLTDIKKAIRLTAVLYNEIKNIRFFDHNADTTILTELQQLKWQRFSNPFYWSGLDYRKRENASKLFARISAKLNTRNLNKELVQLCLNEYVQIFEADDPKKWRCLHQLQEAFKNSEAEKMAVFTHLSSYVQNPTHEDKKENCPEEKNTAKNTPQKLQFSTKKCAVCGRDISSQKQGSKFCSEKLYGKQAKRCRNKASNQARQKREKDKRAKEYLLIDSVLCSGTPFLNLTVTVKYSDSVKNHRPKWDSLAKWENDKVKKVQSIRFAKIGTITHARARKFIRALKKKQCHELVKSVDGGKQVTGSGLNSGSCVINSTSLKNSLSDETTKSR